MPQTAMEAPQLFIAFPSLLRGTPKILVGGQAEEECLPRAVPGREKVFCSLISGLQPVGGGDWPRAFSGHAADPPLWFFHLLLEQPCTCIWIWIKAGWCIPTLKYQVE